MVNNMYHICLPTTDDGEIQAQVHLIKTNHLSLKMKRN